MSKPEEKIISIALNDEYTTAVSNTDSRVENFERGLDMIDGERAEKDYDWMSDTAIPEFASQVATQLSMDVSQYFASKEFVESYLQDGSEQARKAAQSDKELINRTLNQRHLNYYHKYVRARFVTYLNGSVVGLCWWERSSREVQVGEEEGFEIAEGFEGVADEEDIDLSMVNRVTRPVMEDKIDIDRFNFEIIDSRNVFMDNSYTYTIQDKEWVTILDEKNIQYFMELEDSPDYINIDKVIKHARKRMSSKTTEAATRSYDKEVPEPPPVSPGAIRFDRFRRFGKAWAVVEEWDGDVPVKAKIGYDDDGEILDNAVWIDVITEIVRDGTHQELIRFQPTPFIDAMDRPFKPLIRGLCYIHPTRDEGLSDALYAKDLQKSIDDTLNVSNDRVMLATLPTLVGTEATVTDNTSIFFEPEHVMQEMEQGDIRQLQISDNIQGAMQQIAYLTNKMQQATAITPITMGDVPGEATTKATAIAASETRSNIRSNYKALTFENTFLSELYWMIRHMTWRFADPETGQALMGDKVYDFDPSKDYYHKPLSQSIDSQQSKEAKIKNLTQILGYVSNLGHPDTVKLVNLMLVKILTYMGDEYTDIAQALLDPKQPIAGGSDQQEGGGVPTSNQQGIPQSNIEQSVRSATNE